MNNILPSENYLIKLRTFIAIDEWGLYLVLLLLYFSKEYMLFGFVAVYGAICILISYQSYWRLTDVRFKVRTIN